jgi:uncharacterized protein
MYKPKPGDIVHVELASTDLPATRNFLKSVFGWKFEKAEMEDQAGMEYWTWKAGTGPAGGLTTPMGNMPAGTLNYLLVTSIDATAKKITKHGGKILMPKQEIPKIGWFAIYEIPGGVVQAIFQPARKR